MNEVSATSVGELEPFRAPLVILNAQVCISHLMQKCRTSSQCFRAQQNRMHSILIQWFKLANMEGLVKLAQEAVLERPSHSLLKRSGKEHTRAGNLKQPTRQDVINWISEAWADIHVPEEIFIKAFLRCGISNRLDGSEDDLICEEISKDVKDGNESEGQEDEDEEADVDDLDPFGGDDED